jgi:hypothetical protein
MKTPRWIVLVFVLIALCAFIGEGLERVGMLYARIPRSLRILLLWVTASALLIALIALAIVYGYNRGVDDGVEAMGRRLRPARSTLKYSWPDPPHLDAKRVRIGAWPAGRA